MPGPMSIPNGSNEVVTFKEMVTVLDAKGEPKQVSVPRKVPMSQLTGEQRVALAKRGKLTTGKTAVTKKRK